MKKLVAFILVFAVTFAFAGCSGDGLKEKRVRFNFDDAAYLLIDNGDFEKVVKITDQDMLQAYADEFDSHKYARTGKASDDSYCYRLAWYDPENQKLETIFITQENGYKIRHDGNDYKVGADLNISQELYQSLFE